MRPARAAAPTLSRLSAGQACARAAVGTGDHKPITARPHTRRQRRTRPAAETAVPPTAGRLALGASVLIVIVVVALVLAAGGQHGASTTAEHGCHRPYDVPGSATLAVLQRPQTAKDRTLPAVVRRAGRLGGLPKRAIDELSGIIPSSMRYSQTLPDGREVFLALAHGSNSVSRCCGC